MLSFQSIFFAIASVGLVHAVAVKRQATTTPTTAADINSIASVTHFASTAYCNPSTTVNWSCGANCQANPDFIPVAAGGDGNATQFWYVGFSPSLEAVIVAHQGIDPTQFLDILTDLDFIPEQLNSTLFPGVPSTVAVHSGFANEHASTALTILSYVKSALSAHSSAFFVIVVGHSLGAALALLDGVYLRTQLPDVGIGVVTYGMPRVGNQEFADFVDVSFDGEVVHVNNQEDPVPVLPPTFLGFHHPSGEIHITDFGIWENCHGQENPSTLCIVGDVPDPLKGNLTNHMGPYGGITMGC